MRVPIPRVPVSTANLGGFNAPGVVPVRDQGPGQLADVGNAITAASFSATRVGSAIQEEVDEALVTEMDAQAADLWLRVKSEYTAKVGREAVDGFDATQKQFRDGLAKIADMAKTPDQRRAAARAMGERTQQGLFSLAAHRDNEARNWNIGSKDAGRLAAVTSYLNSLGNSEDMAVHRAVAIRNAEEGAKLRGLDEAGTKLHVLDTTTRMHAGAVDALLAADRPMEALAYLEQNGGEIAPVERAQTTQKARAGFVEWGARQLDESMPDVGQRLAVVNEWEQAGRLTPTEAESGRRHVMQFETMRLQADALAERKLRDDFEKWAVANPMLRAEDNPDLKARADALGVVLTRDQQTVPAFEEMLRGMPMDQLRRLDDNQLRNLLSRGLNKSDQNRWFATVRGDQTTRKLEEDIQRLAFSILKVDRSAFDEWRRNTIDAGIARERDRLKRDLTDAEIRQFVLAPLGEQVMVDDTLSPDNAMPLEQALRTGIDPSDIYEPIRGKAPVYMSEIPVDRVAEIATAFRRRNPRGTLSFSMLAQAYDRMGRPASAMDLDKAENAAAVQAALKEAKIDLWPTFTKKSAEAAERRLGRQSVLPVPMTDDGAGAWWSGSLNEQEKMRKMAEGMQGNR
jgi:hypothetical protein